jgi:hypothetical protein
MADTTVLAISDVVALWPKPSAGPNHPKWKCISGGAHGPYHPTQGGPGGYIISGGPHDPGIGGPTRK